MYIAGSSMGGGGTFMTSFHNPEFFAAIAPTLALVEYGYWGETQFVGKFGTRSLGITARNGVNIWDHTSIPYLVKNNPDTDFPPVVSGIGSKDPKMSMRMYRWLYKVFAEQKRGIWGAWGNFGHSTGSYSNIDYTRFKRNEMYPVLANASNDDNYGQHDPDTVNSATDDDSLNLRCDSAGNMNAQIDWVSSLRTIPSLPGNNAPVDKTDTIAITFTTSKTQTFVDITPRRIQNFAVDAAYSYNWKNIDITTGTAIASGSILPDAKGLLTVQNFEINGTGNRLVITRGESVASEGNLLVPSAFAISTSPNPFNPVTTIKISCLSKSNELVKVKVYSTCGKCLFTSKKNVSELAKNGIKWDASELSSGVYIVTANIGKSTISKTISLVK
jgi:hypothetical protein